MRLATTELGEGRPLIVVHGLFGSGRNWGAISKRLSDERRVIAVDMRNHGDSPWSDDHSYPAQAGDLVEVIGSDGPADVLGHSMGGKAAMVLALTRPEVVRRLILVDIAPVAYEHTQMPLIRAMQDADLSEIDRRSDVSLGVSPEVQAFLLQSLDVHRKCWLLNLDALAAEMDRITGWPGTEGRFDGPVLALRGARSDYVRDEDLPGMERLFPNLTVQSVDAGHWLHAEKPREVEAAVREFLRS